MNKPAARFFRGIAVTLVLTLAGAAEAQPQDPVALARAELTGPSTREWVLTQIIVFLGPGNRCQQGEALRFRATRVVEIESCIDGQMTKRPVPWILRENGPLDPVLNYDGNDYLLTFHSEGNRRFLKLRLHKLNGSKIDLAQDRNYRLSQD